MPGLLQPGERKLKVRMAGALERRRAAHDEDGVAKLRVGADLEAGGDEPGIRALLLLRRADGTEVRAKRLRAREHGGRARAMMSPSLGAALATRVHTV